MRLLRGLSVLAIVAALWGAPSSVSAATNELSSAGVSPASGTVTTVFTFRVRYEGSFPATAVVVIVGGLAVPMSLESGSLGTGWWSGSSLLPSGAWSTSFRATTAQGPAPTLNGPVVIVAGPTPAPSASGGAPPSSGATPESAPADGLDGPTAPPAAPAPPPEEAAATAPAVASPAPEESGPTPGTGGSGGSGAPTEGGSDAPSAGGTVATPAPGGGGAGGGGSGNDAPARQGAPAASPPTSPAPADDPAIIRPVADTEPRDDRAAIDEKVSDVLLIGLAGVASVAIVGTLLLIAGRRREPARATVRPAALRGGLAPTRRVAPTGRARPSHDPIVAALGVDEEMAARRAIRRATRKVRDDGPDPRPGRR